MAESIDLPRTYDLNDELARLEIEDAIERLDGIEHARLVPGERRPVDELHVVVSPERNPKHTARDLQTLLHARFGVEIDRRVISVVALPEETTKRLRDGMPRVELDAVHLAVRAEETSVSVELVEDERIHLGCAGPVDDAQLVTATARATLDALLEALAEVSLRLVAAQVVHMGPERVALVVVETVDGRRREMMTGSAVVRRNEADAVARAVLDATNRLNRD